MSFGIGVGDLIALGKLAWAIYTRLHDAPTEAKAVRDDVGLLSFLLKSTDSSLLRAADLGNDYEGLEAVVTGIKAALDDLKQLLAKFSDGKHGLKDRIRWMRYKDVVQATHERVRSAVDMLTAFNSAVALSLGLSFGTSQQTIIAMLNNIQAEVQAGKREGSVLSQALTDNEAIEDNVVLEEVVKELEQEGTSLTDLRANLPLISRWLKNGIKLGEWEEQSTDTLSSSTTAILTPGSSPDEPFVCPIEILSAVYGDWDVTDTMRRFFSSNITPATQFRSFTVNNFFFGRDPRPGSKILILIWRKIISTDSLGNKTYSSPQIYPAGEHGRVVLNYTTSLSTAPPTNFSYTSGPYVLSASYHDRDVTPTVSRLVTSRFSVSHTIFGGDPAFGIRKFLIIAYSYLPDTPLASIQTLILPEDAEVYIRPRLTIHAAQWADADITAEMRAYVGPDQELRLTARNGVSHPDPWYGVVKTLVICYQYSDGPEQLLVASDWTGEVAITPGGTIRRGAFFNPAYREGEGVQVLAAVWGQMPLDLRAFGRLRDQGGCVCSNEWFEFDGLPNMLKTAHVFVKVGERVVGLVKREGETLELPSA